MKEYHKKYYLKNRDKYIQKANDFVKKYPNRRKEWALSIKKLVISHYTKGTMSCVCCGESIFHFLTMDHINGGGTQHRKKLDGGNKIYRWLKNNNFPEGFQVLCYNCNCGREKTSSKICPHKLGDKS